MVPYPQATDHHQEANACVAAQFGAAVIVHQRNPGERGLSDSLTHLLENRLLGRDLPFDPLIDMRKRMKKLAAHDAEKKLIKILMSCI